MQNNFYICIMAGGAGTRLWPISRCNLPKQFHNLCSAKSLIQETYERVEGIVPKENIYVSLVKAILATSQKQLPQVPKVNFIVEGEARNTAPAIGLVATTIRQKNPNAVIATIASDHSIEKLNNFREGLKTVLNFVQKNPAYFVTVGIKPTLPDTGLGYIKVGRKISKTKLYEVEEFVEKPNLKTAQRYLKSGQYLWNASYFIGLADTILALYRKHTPEITQQLDQIYALLDKKGSETKIDQIYHKMPSVPIDTAIAEKTRKMAVLPVDLGWSDIGNWTALYEILTKKTGNHTISQGNHIGVDDKNCLIYAQDKLLTTVGLTDIIVVDTPDVTLICDKKRAQDVKRLIEKIKERGKSSYL